jgi:hypothetical protein
MIDVVTVDFPDREQPNGENNKQLIYRSAVQTKQPSQSSHPIIAHSQ